MRIKQHPEEQSVCLHQTEFYHPRFCNTVEAGSSFTMEVVNARTETSDRFITDSADTPVEVNHNIRVDSLGDRPSVGKVSAFMEGSILEGRGTAIPSVKVHSEIRNPNYSLPCLTPASPLHTKRSPSVNTPRSMGQLPSLTRTWPGNQVSGESGRKRSQE